LGSVFLLDAIGESGKFGSLDVKHPFEIRVHLALHLVNLLEGVELLSNDIPRLVGVSVVINDLGCDYECTDERRWPLEPRAAGRCFVNLASRK
jgi:hypothetical protein